MSSHRALREADPEAVPSLPTGAQELDLPPARSSRARLALAFLCVFVAGLTVKFGGEPLPGWLRNAAGGAAYTSSLGLALLLVRPALGAKRAACFALLWSASVELWQLAHLWPLHGTRDHLLSRLVLGSHFDPWDLLAYALGALLILALAAAATSDRRLSPR
jgi:hypothetical protein